LVLASVIRSDRGRQGSLGLTKRRHTPDIIVEVRPIPLPTLFHDVVELLKASLNVVVAEERALNGLEDLTQRTTAQIGLMHIRVRTTGV
jgi:hypothetical protein